MKKAAFIIALVLGMTFSLAGCKQEEKGTKGAKKSTEVTEENKTAKSTSAKPKESDYNEGKNSSDTTDKKEEKNDNNEKESILAKEDMETYVSERLGFAIDFPKSWHGYYIVDESYENLVRVSFIGKSKTSEGFDEDSTKKSGLLMFFIGPEVDREFSDSVKQIGTVASVDYYYGTSTDYPVGALFVSPESNPEEMGINEEEMKLMEEDFKKAKEMEKDVEDILKTFRENDQ